MLKIFLGIGLALGLIITTSPAEAKKMYVVDELVITIRQDRSVSGGVVGRARSLDKVEVVESDDKWAKVKTADGTLGWVQKRYLSETPPIGLKLRQIEEENRRLSEKVGILEEENQKLKEISANLEKKLASERAVLSKLENDYRELGEHAADYVVLKKEYEESRNQLAKIKAESDQLRKTADETINARRIKWFITGGVVLLAGWLVGIISARKKKATSSLY